MNNTLVLSKPTIGFIIDFGRLFLPYHVAEYCRVGGGKVYYGNTDSEDTVIMRYEFSKNTGLPLVTMRNDFRGPDIYTYRRFIESQLRSYSMFMDDNYKNYVFMGNLRFREVLSTKIRNVTASFNANELKVKITDEETNSESEFSFFKLNHSDPIENELYMRCKAYMACRSSSVMEEQNNETKDEVKAYSR